MGVLWLNESDVDRLLTPADAVAAVEQMFQSQAAGQVQNIPRRRAAADGMMLHSMSAADARLKRAAWKQYSTTRHRARFLVGLYGSSRVDSEPGELLALISADRLGKLRTGAVCAVAARRMLTDDVGILHAPAVITVVGCGGQAASQVECIGHVFPHAQLRVAGRDRAKVHSFATAMADKLSRSVAASESIAAGVADAELVITITSAREPVLELDMLGNCRLIVAAGSNQARNRELPTSVIVRASRIAVDDDEGVHREAGDLILSADEVGAEAVWSKVVPVAQLQPWSTEQIGTDVQIFKSVGMAAADLAAASWVYDRAREMKVGNELPDLFAD